jgi:hypothetical protein
MTIAAFALREPYEVHALHRLERAWPETNCYIDVWIEIIHALGQDPMAMLPVVFAIDFDADQWTFFKPSHDDLFQLYGMEVQELNVWKTLLENTKSQLAQGRLVLTEADAFYLPDTKGTDYRQKHTKTTIGIHSMDVEAQTMGYFHNAGFYQLDGEDFAKLMRVGQPFDPNHMPFFAEFVRLDRLTRNDSKALAELSLDLSRKYLQRRPMKNPIAVYRQSFLADMESIKAQGMELYHAYAFANLRQLGSACELAALYLKWLDRSLNIETVTHAAASFASISDLTKAMLLKMARTVATKKPVDFDPLLSEMELRWTESIELLGQRIS